MATALASVELAAPPARTSWGNNRPLSRQALAAAWYAGEADPFGLAAIAAAEQTADDLRLVTNCVRAIAAKLADNGRRIAPPRAARVASPAQAGGNDEWQWRDAVAAGLAAVVEWRNGTRPAPVVPGTRLADAVATVAWRAVSDELSREAMGQSVELSTVSDEWLVDAVEPLAVACVAGIETRGDKAARWLRDRGAVRRKAALPIKMEGFKHGHGRRVALVERIEMAAARLLGGDSIDNAARAVGFKERMHNGKLKEAAGVQLARAARAVGLNFALVQPSNRPSMADDFNPFRRPLAIDANEPEAEQLKRAGLLPG